MKVKENLVHRSTFPKPLLSLNTKPAILSGIACKMVVEGDVAHALMSQLAIKTLGLSIIKFQVL